MLPEKPYRFSDDHHRKIRYTLQKQGHLHDAVMDLVCGDRREWTLSDWLQVLESVESSELTIAEYIDAM